MEKLLPAQRRALGAALRRRRMQLGWTQQELASLVKLARAYISHIEAGTKAPSMAVLTRCCRAMGATTSDVLIECGLSQPREDGVHPLLLEGVRHLDPDLQRRLANAWPDLERFLVHCLSTTNSS